MTQVQVKRRREQGLLSNKNKDSSNTLLSHSLVCYLELSAINQSSHHFLSDDRRDCAAPPFVIVAAECASSSFTSIITMHVHIGAVVPPACSWNMLPVVLKTYGLSRSSIIWRWFLDTKHASCILRWCEQSLRDIRSWTRRRQ